MRFGQAKHTKLEQDAMLAGAGEEEELTKCYGDITGKELHWQAVKQAREQELKYLRALAAHEKVDEYAAVAKYNIAQIDTKWVDTDKAFEGELMQIRSRNVAREFKSVDWCMSMFLVHSSTPRLRGLCWCNCQQKTAQEGYKGKIGLWKNSIYA